MSTQLKLRRGTTAQHSTFTGAEGEITVDTTKDTVVVHDGSTAGGVPLAKESGSALSPTSVTLSTGTANGVVYLNGSKVLTTGSALTFDGAKLGVGVTPQSIIGAKVGIATGGSNTNTVGTSIGLDGAGTQAISGLRWTGTAFNGIYGGYYATQFVTDSANALATEFVNTGGTPFLWGISGSEQMRLTSTGLGIGTSSPSYKLDIHSSSSPTIRVQNDSSGVGNYSQLILGTANTFSGAASAYLRGISTNAGNSATDLAFGVNANGGGASYEAMRLDSSGNLGLGVTPSAWNAAFKTVQVSKAAISGLTNSAYFSSNVYYGASGWNYIASDYALYYGQENGSHKWYTAPSGTAGAAISFTQAMTLDSSGNLALGVTGASARLTLDSGSAGLMAYLNSSAANGGYITGYSSNTAVWDFGTAKQAFNTGTSTDVGINTRSGFLGFGTASTERMRITSGGEVYIAGTTDQGAYNLQCNGTGVWGAGAYVNGSDARLKENVTTLDTSLGLINAMRPVTFTYKEDYSKDRAVQTGFIAQELQEVLAGKDYLDGIVQVGPEHLNVAYQNLIPLLVKAVQELTARVAQLEGN